MAHIVVGIDRNKSSSEDIKFRDTVASALKKAGHSVEKLQRGPNFFAKYSYGNEGKNPKGKIGIYLIAAGTYSIADFYYGAAKNGASFKYAYFGIRGDLGVRPHNMSEFKSAKIGADADCPSSLCAHIKGLTFPQMNKKLKDKCQIVFGKNAEEMGKALVEAIGGGSSESNKDNTKKVGQGGTIKDALQKLLTYWDGEVECYIRGDEVHVNRIRRPQDYYSGVLSEGVNVFSDTVKVTDVNPNTCNYLEVIWTGGTIVIKDENLIKRFGVNKTSIVANKKIKLDENNKKLNQKKNSKKKSDK